MVNSQFEVVMKKHFILVKGECGTCVAVDLRDPLIFRDSNNSKCAGI